MTLEEDLKRNLKFPFPSVMDMHIEPSVDRDYVLKENEKVDRNIQKALQECDIRALGELLKELHFRRYDDQIGDLKSGELAKGLVEYFARNCRCNRT